MAALASTDDTIGMLIERLNWPVRMVRWQASREYGALLSDAQHAEKALALYLKWLAEREFESEVVSGLTALFCTERDRLPSFDLVAASIRRPSVLADGMLQFIYGPGKVMDSWQTAHSGAAPPSFEAEDYFLTHKTAQVPPVLGNSLQKLETKTGFPLVKQWAFEWQELVRSTAAPRSGYPYYFCDFGSHRAGLNGQFSQRQCEVYRSAYLRTLSCAVDCWDMPSQQAKRLCLDALPANPGLIQMMASYKPSWIGDAPERYFAKRISTSELVSELTKRSGHEPEMRPVYWRLPLSMDVSEFSELSMSAVMASGDFVPSSEALDGVRRAMPWVLSGGFLFGGKLPSEVVTEHTLRGRTGSYVPLTLDAWPLPTGFWHNDYFQAGVALPAPYALERDATVLCEKDHVAILQGQNKRGAWRVWHDHWSPIYARDGATRCGMSTELHAADLKRTLDRHGLKLGWIVGLKACTRKTDYGDFECSSRHDFVFD